MIADRQKLLVDRNFDRVWARRKARADDQLRRRRRDELAPAREQSAVGPARVCAWLGFAEHTPLVEPLSLDEAYLDVTENLQGIASATEIAEAIRAKIKAGNQPDRVRRRLLQQIPSPNSVRPEQAGWSVRHYTENGPDVCRDTPSQEMSWR